MTNFVWKPSIVHNQITTNIHMKNHPFMVVTNGPNCGSHPLEPKFIFLNNCNKKNGLLEYHFKEIIFLWVYKIFNIKQGRAKQSGARAKQNRQAKVG